MNVVDYAVIGIIGVSVLFGCYRGFISTLLNSGGCLVAFGASFALYPKLAESVRGNGDLIRTLIHYTDASSRIGDLELAVSNVSQLTAEKIAFALQTEICHNEDWENNWKQYFKPIPVGERLLIQPIWQEAVDAGDRAVFKIEPGLAFGSGTHETTRL